MIFQLCASSACVFSYQCYVQSCDHTSSSASSHRQYLPNCDHTCSASFSVCPSQWRSKEELKGFWMGWDRLVGTGVATAQKIIQLQWPHFILDFSSSGYPRPSVSSVSSSYSDDVPLCQFVCDDVPPYQCQCHFLIYTPIRQSVTAVALNHKNTIKCAPRSASTICSEIFVCQTSFCLCIK